MGEIFCQIGRLAYVTAEGIEIVGKPDIIFADKLTYHISKVEETLPFDVLRAEAVVARWCAPRFCPASGRSKRSLSL